MNMILLGAPGAGKGTQAVMIASKLGIPHISTGDIFRKNIKEGTPIGLKAKAFIDKGHLVPDEVVIELVADRLKSADCERGYLLDGFPRTTAQAVALGDITTIERVINIDVDLNKLAQRIMGRRVCTKCGESYHITTHSSNICSKCDGELYQRDDDNEVSVKARLQIYTEMTSPLIEFYTKEGVLRTVNGMQAIGDVYEDIIKVLGK